MDNILKLLLGVLGVAGLIAMVTPTNLVVSPPPEAVAPPPAIASAIPENPDGEAPPEDPEVIEDEDDPFSTGEPMIDGNPVNQPGQQDQNNYGETPQQAVPAFDPASYGLPNIAGYTPAPISTGPAGNETNMDMPAQ